MNKPPALSSTSASEIICDNLNSMHAAREEFIKFESDEKIKRALRHNVRATDDSEIENGERFFINERTVSTGMVQVSSSVKMVKNFWFGMVEFMPGFMHVGLVMFRVKL